MSDKSFMLIFWLLCAALLELLALSTPEIGNALLMCAGCS